jgi:hypothetical protein
MGSKYTEEEINFIKSKPENESWPSYYKRCYTGIRTLGCMHTKALNLGIRHKFGNRRKYTYNKDFWKEPNLINSYWGGFFAADGNLSNDTRNRKNHRSGIELSIVDEDHLLSFHKDCGYTGKLYYRERTKNNKQNKMVTSSIKCGEDWHEDMKRNFSLTPNKTFTLQPPNLTNPEHIKAFIQGFIDGDGHIGYNSRSVRINISCASKDFLLWVDDRMEEMSRHCNYYNRSKIKLAEVVNPDNGNITYVSNIAGFQAAYIIDEFRKLPLPYLKRKWDKPEVLQFIKESKDKHPTKFS